MREKQGGITALVVAGRRPGIDPLAARFGVEDKALIEVAGEAMLSRVARTLLDHPAIDRIVVLAQEPDRLLDAIPWLKEDTRVETRPGGNSVSEAVSSAVMARPGGFPFLLTTADNVLLDGAIIDAFLAAAGRGGDLAIGMVERRVLLASYPDSRRTWLKFRGDAWSGANLFWLGTAKVESALSFWRGVEQQRKKGRAIIRAFGPFMLMMVAFRLWSLPAALRRAGRRFGIDARLVPLPIAEACIDVDKLADHVLATEILGQRAREASSERI